MRPTDPGRVGAETGPGRRGAITPLGAASASAHGAGRGASSYPVDGA